MNSLSIFERDFIEVEKCIYKKYNFSFSSVSQEDEGVGYGAGSFKLEKLSIKVRTAKITPKKIGQFVTLWKRGDDGETRPHDLSDNFDLYIVNTRKENQFGQFVFPKTALEECGIISSKVSDGKRGFRVYPPWDTVSSTQALKSQKWQLKYFIDLNEENDLESIERLYKIK